MLPLKLRHEEIITVYVFLAEIIFQHFRHRYIRLLPDHPETFHFHRHDIPLIGQKRRARYYSYLQYDCVLFSLSLNPVDCIEHTACEFRNLSCLTILPEMDPDKLSDLLFG